MFKKIKFLFLSTLIFLLTLLSTNVVLANQNKDLPNVVIQPGLFCYPLKRSFEKLLYYANPTSDLRANYYRDLLQKRVAELNYVTNNKLLREHQQASERVSFYAGKLTDHIIANKLEGKKMEISDLMKKDKALLANMRDKFPANSSFWMLVQHSINSLDMNLEKLGN